MNDILGAILLCLLSAGLTVCMVRALRGRTTDCREISFMLDVYLDLAPGDTFAIRDGDSRHSYVITDVRIQPPRPNHPNDGGYHYSVIAMPL